MKKLSLIYGGLLFAAVAATSCTDMLDKEPLDQFTNNPMFWNNESSVEGYANRFYNLFEGYGNQAGGGDFYFTKLTDDQVGSTFENWKYINPQAEISDWKSTWEEIRRANIMIESLNTMATSMDQTTKNHWLGVARLMRGWQYWDLVRKFGDCPWVDHNLDVDDPLLYAAREDRDVIMDKVLEDLNFAVTNINESSTKKYWSRNMAKAMKAHICLWEGTFRKYRKAEDHQKAPDMEGSRRFLEECVSACNELMTAGYQLSDNYQALYNSTSLDGNPEIIFYKEYKKDVLMHRLIMFTCMTTMLDGMSKDAFDSYLFIDGNTYANTSAEYKKDEYNKPELKISANDSKQHLNIKKMLSVRDKRLAQQIDTVLYYSGNPWPRIEGGASMTCSSGYGVSKFDNVTLEKNDRELNRNYTCAPLYWLSVIYLNYAEAKAELGTITNSDLNNTINLLKDRAGLPHITISPADQGDNDMGVSPLIWEIRRERRCELMFDNDFRYWDLIRWHQLDKLDNSTNPDILLGADITQAPSTTVDMRGNYMDGSHGNTRRYEYKHYLYPIPTGQITLNSKLGQNPGWTQSSK